MICSWCGDQHPADRLCARGQRALTRRSFCFLFGAGVVGLLTPLPSFDIGQITTYLDADQYVKGLLRRGSMTVTMNFENPDPLFAVGKMIQIDLARDLAFEGQITEIRNTDEGAQATIRYITSRQ